MATPEPVTVQLTSPVKDFGRDVTHVTISREVKGADLIAIDGMGKHKATLTLISRLTGLSWEATVELSLRDIGAIEDAMAPFAVAG